MRIRQIKPDFWSDKALAEFDDSTRLFYIGLWMEADDDGYFRIENGRLAADLYPYKGVVGRERFVSTALLRLADSGHVKMLDCGLHAQVPNVPRYQVVASTRRTVRTHGEHNAQCMGNASPSSAIPERERERERDGNGESLRTSAREAAEAILVDESSSEPAKKAARKALEKMA